MLFFAFGNFEHSSWKKFLGVVLVNILLNSSNQWPNLYSISWPHEVIHGDVLQPFLYASLFLFSIVLSQYGYFQPSDSTSAPDRTGLCTRAEIASAIQAFQKEDYMSMDMLRHASVPVLRSRLQHRNMDDRRNCIEKQDLVTKLQEHHQDNTQCCICYEDYKVGETLVLLSSVCTHMYHLECLDKWAHSHVSTRQQYHEIPTCPLCKSPLVR